MNIVISCECPRSIGRAMNTSPLQFIRTRSCIRLLNTIISGDEIRDISEAVYSRNRCPPKAGARGSPSLQFEVIDCGATVFNAADTGSCCGWSEIGSQSCTEDSCSINFNTRGESVWVEQWFQVVFLSQGPSPFWDQIICGPLYPPPPRTLKQIHCWTCAFHANMQRVPCDTPLINETLCSSNSAF